MKFIKKKKLFCSLTIGLVLVLNSFLIFNNQNTLKYSSNKPSARKSSFFSMANTNINLQGRITYFQFLKLIEKESNILFQNNGLSSSKTPILNHLVRLKRDFFLEQNTPYGKRKLHFGIKSIRADDYRKWKTMTITPYAYYYSANDAHPIENYNVQVNVTNFKEINVPHITEIRNKTDLQTVVYAGTSLEYPLINDSELEKIDLSGLNLWYSQKYGDRFKDNKILYYWNFSSSEARNKIIKRYPEKGKAVVSFDWYIEPKAIGGTYTQGVSGFPKPEFFDIGTKSIEFNKWIKAVTCHIVYDIEKVPLPPPPPPVVPDNPEDNNNNNQDNNKPDPDLPPEPAPDGNDTGKPPRPEPEIPIPTPPSGLEGDNLLSTDKSMTLGFVINIAIASIMAIMLMVFIAVLSVRFSSKE